MVIVPQLGTVKRTFRTKGKFISWIKFYISKIYKKIIGNQKFEPRNLWAKTIDNRKRAKKQLKIEIPGLDPDNWILSGKSQYKLETTGTKNSWNFSSKPKMWLKKPLKIEICKFYFESCKSKNAWKNSWNSNYDRKSKQLEIELWWKKPVKSVKLWIKYLVRAS